MGVVVIYICLMEIVQSMSGEGLPAVVELILNASFDAWFIFFCPIPTRTATLGWSQDALIRRTLIPFYAHYSVISSATSPEICVSKSWFSATICHATTSCIGELTEYFCDVKSNLKLKLISGGLWLSVLLLFRSPCPVGWSRMYRWMWTLVRPGDALWLVLYILSRSELIGGNHDLYLIPESFVCPHCVEVWWSEAAYIY
jgi:hypothetical protein